MTLIGAAVVCLAAIAPVVVCRRWGVWTWLSVLAGVPTIAIGLTAPISHQVALLLLAAGVATACWRPRTDSVQVGGGLLLAGAAAVVVQLSNSTGRHVLDDRIPWLAIGAAVALAVAAAAIPRAPWLSPVRVTCALVAALPLVLLVGARSTDALVAWWPAAGALGLSLMLRGERRRAAAQPQIDAVDRAAIDDFDTRYAIPALAPVAIVIAAYDEEAGLPAVLASLPETICDLPADVIVVDDGSNDETVAAAEASERAFVVRCATNRGQGRALRLGYRVAREHGADYIITTDADGQYDVADLPTLLAPILAGEADFVTGSRRLGHQPVQDPLRRLGVHVFAWLVSAMVGRYLTDTSFGMRAMRAEATAAVTLNQPQYQSSELLIGMFSHGFRVLEVPGTMHVRGNGASKKGKNLVYGRRYAGVVLGTWWREACPTPIVAAPAGIAEPTSVPLPLSDEVPILQQLRRISSGMGAAAPLGERVGRR